MNNMGKQGRDKITGFKGIIVGYCSYIFGCNQYGLAPRTLKDGKRINTEWFDEGRVEIIGKGISPKSVKVKDPGADRNLDAPQ